MVSFFTWEACWGKVLTLDQLQKGGWTLVNRYALCKELETIDHILLHCDKTRVLWQLVFSSFGIQWVIFEMIRETLLGWPNSFVGRRRVKAWKVAPLCIFWTISKERNHRCFENGELSDQRIKNIFLSNFSLWVKGYIAEVICLWWNS